MPGKRRCLLADAFHKTTVTDDRIGVVVEDALAESSGQHPLGDGHSNCVGKPLTERPGSRFYPCGVVILRMACRSRIERAELPDFGDRHVFVAGEVENRV